MLLFEQLNLSSPGSQVGSPSCLALQGRLLASHSTQTRFIRMQSAEVLRLLPRPREREEGANIGSYEAPYEDM